MAFIELPTLGGTKAFDGALGLPGSYLLMAGKPRHHFSSFLANLGCKCRGGVVTGPQEPSRALLPALSHSSGRNTCSCFLAGAKAGRELWGSCLLPSWSLGAGERVFALLECPHVPGGNAFFFFGRAVWLAGSFLTRDQTRAPCSGSTVS